MNEMTFTLNSPLTEEEWDLISDVDFDNTDEITFHTKHGKEVTFVKRKKGKWVLETFQIRCSGCNKVFSDNLFPSNYCPHCGADMRGGSK